MPAETRQHRYRLFLVRLDDAVQRQRLLDRRRPGRLDDELGIFTLLARQLDRLAVTFFLAVSMPALGGVVLMTVAGLIVLVARFLFVVSVPSALFLAAVLMRFRSRQLALVRHDRDARYGTRRQHAEDHHTTRQPA